MSLLTSRQVFVVTSVSMDRNNGISLMLICDHLDQLARIAWGGASPKFQTPDKV